MAKANVGPFCFSIRFECQRVEDISPIIWEELREYCDSCEDLGRTVYYFHFREEQNECVRVMSQNLTYARVPHTVAFMERGE